MLDIGKHSMRLQPLFFGMSYGYIACGPHLKADEAPQFTQHLKKIAKRDHLIFTRVDKSSGLENQFPSRKSHSSYPETTLTLDLKLSDKELLAQMKRKGRYNISLAQKKGVIVKRAESKQEKLEYAKHFYNLMMLTTSRDGFFAHDLSYYEKMITHLPMAEIFIAFAGDVPLSGAICTYFEGVATYYYGASSNEHRGLMSPYLVQWEAIQYGKKQKCHTYDFLGIAPENAPKDHPWKGITDFKKKFGGTVVENGPSTDLVHMPLWYQVFRVIKAGQKLWLRVKRLLRK